MFLKNRVISSRLKLKYRLHRRLFQLIVIFKLEDNSNWDNGVTIHQKNNIGD